MVNHTFLQNKLKDAWAIEDLPRILSGIIKYSRVLICILLLTQNPLAGGYLLVDSFPSLLSSLTNAFILELVRGRRESVIPKVIDY